MNAKADNQLNQGVDLSILADAQIAVVGVWLKLALVEGTQKLKRYNCEIPEDIIFNFRPIFTFRRCNVGGIEVGMF